MRARLGLLATIVLGALALGAVPAQADHHLVKIAEVFPGDTVLGTTNEYVELEMTSSGQDLFGGTNSTVTLQAANGTVTATASLNSNLSNGERGRRILVAATGLQGKTPNFTWTAGDHLNPAGGAVCFDPKSGVGFIDCVSWGSFTGSTTSPTGGDAPAIPNGSSLARKRPACGSGLIDTNDPSDWTTGGYDPQNNSDPALTGDPCPQTTITKHPKKKTTKRRAKFEFTANLGIDEFKCKLDRAPFKDCTSPFTKRVKRGKHTFKVKAAGDDSPASFSWKVVRR